MRPLLSRRNCSRCGRYLSLVEEGIAMYLKKFRKAGGRLTAYPLHKVVCACEDSVLMILRNLLKMLPKRIGVMIAPLAIARNCARTGRKLLQFPGVNLLICQWLADDLADLAGNLCKGV